MATSVLAISNASAQDSTKKAFSTEVIVSRCREFAASKVSSDGILMQETFDNGFCFGLFTMTQSTVMTVNSKTGERMLGICAPEGTSTTQLAKVFVQFADAHPERLNQHFYVVLFECLHNAFPCAKKRT